MRIKKNVVLVFLLLLIHFSIAAQGLTLQECYIKAEANSPLRVQLDAYQSMGDLKLANRDVAWRPKVLLKGQVSLQSDVTRLDLNVPIEGFEIPEMSKDWYKAYLDVSQTIYDGGLNKKGKESELIQTALLQSAVEVELFEVRSRINGAYFSALFLQIQIEQAELRLETLLTQRKRLASAVDNGMQHRSELLLMDAEILKAQQLITTLKDNLSSSFELLSMLIGEDVHSVSTLLIPEEPLMKDKALKNARPELRLFDHQKRQLDAQSEMLQTSRSPKVLAFGQAGYGRPGLNMLSDQFTDWYVVGLALNWEVYDWNETKRKKQQFELQKEIVDSKQENFLYQLEMAQKTKWNSIRTQMGLIKSDQAIKDLYQEVEKTASSRLENGVISSAEYIQKMNASLEAGLMVKQRKIDILKLKYEYLTLIGLEYENAK